MKNKILTLLASIISITGLYSDNIDSEEEVDSSIFYLYRDKDMNIDD